MHALVAAATLVLVVAVIDVFADAPLRTSIEAEVNRRLDGYSATIGGVDLRPWNLSREVRDLTLVQDAHPDPPVASFPLLVFSVQWTALLHGELVADLDLEAPALHVNLIQLASEADDDAEFDERGWQAALQAMYPLEINWLRVGNGAVTYIDEDPERPLELTRVSGEARDIRNVRSQARTYPSPVHVEATVFGVGSARFDGHVDFLAEPWLAVRGRVSLDEVPLDRLGPVVEDYRLVVYGGALWARGGIEYGPEFRSIHLETVSIDLVHVDYVHDPELTRRAVEAVAEPEKPVTPMRIDVVHLIDAELGFINAAADPDYRLYVSGADVRLTNVTNDEQGESAVTVRGAFMGSGTARLDASFRSDRDGADFDLDMAIEGTELAALNDVLQAYGNFDAAGGTFSLYSELGVADGRIGGYIKPLFADVDVYTAAQDKRNNPLKRLWEGIVEGVANLLENEQDAVATVADLAGSVEDPRASNLQVVLGLVENAFFDAILPGFESQAGAGARVARDGRERNDAKRKRDREG